MSPECFGKWIECSVLEDPVVDEDGAMFWTIPCPERHDCYLKWKELEELE